MNAQQLAAATGCKKVALAQAWLVYVQAAMDAYNINTIKRQAAFLANVGHESGGLLFTTEIWGPTKWQLAYEGNKGLGNTQPGDGKRYLGRGLIQLTGRANAARMRDRLRLKFPDINVPDFEQFPAMLAQTDWAALTAADFWDDHHINDFADKGDFDGCCDLVNRGKKTTPEGDALGFADRLALYKAGLNALSKGM